MHLLPFGGWLEAQTSTINDRGPRQTSAVAPSDGNDRVKRGKSNKKNKACPPPYDQASCIDKKTGEVRLYPRPFDTK